tara:strand:- start:548829 stop:549638 length:810 start_codon:yes stop_codon:yes gene_type:complete
MYEGFTEPKYQIMVAATEIGQLEAIHVEIGDVVTAGQTIAQLEDSLQQSSVKIALTQAEMHGELDAARAEAAMHRNRTASIRELASKRMARPDELVRAETDLEIALARAAAAAEQQHLRKLELERYELQLRRRRVLAPMAGVISQIFHYPGEYLTPGDPAVVQLLVIDELIAVFNVPAEDAGNLRVGQPVLVSLRSTSQNVRAQLTTVSPHIDGESGTVQVRVTLDNRERILKSGDRCTMQLMADDRAATPRQASRSEPSRSLLGGRQE